jgi:hypothetical protein
VSNLIEEGLVSETPTELEAPDPTLSTDAADSTYAAAEPLPDNPPAGSRVEQTLGKAGADTKSAKKASSPSSSSGS